MDIHFQIQSDDSDPLIDSSSSSEALHSTSGSDPDSDWSDILGPNWRFMSEMLLDNVTISITELDSLSSSSDPVSMPDLFSVTGSSESSSASESDSDFDLNWSSGAKGDDEDSQESSSDNSNASTRPPLLRQWVRSHIHGMYEHRYEQA
jgi:hypothetical protein